MNSHKGFAPIIVVAIIAAMIMGSGVLYYQIQKQTSQTQFQRSYQPPTKARVKTETVLEKTSKEPPKKESATEQEIKLKPAPSNINSPVKMPPPVVVVEENLWKPTEDAWQDATPQAPINLALPLAVADIEEAQTVLRPRPLIT